MNLIEALSQHLPVIEREIGYTFKNRSLLALAFVHRSYVNENHTINEHNERLEFLGDAVLGMIISDYLYRQLPDVPEGELSYLRSRLVEASSCVSFIHTLHIEPYLLLGKGEKMNDGRGRESILADLMEALIGAIYLDSGYDAVSHFIFQHFLPQIESIIKTPLKNWKALLQDFCQKKYQKAPRYQVLDEAGPDHSKTFHIAAIINDIELGRGTGASKKEAQQAAAAQAVKKLESTLPS